MSITISAACGWLVANGWAKQPWNVLQAGCVAFPSTSVRHWMLSPHPDPPGIQYLYIHPCIGGLNHCGLVLIADTGGWVFSIGMVDACIGTVYAYAQQPLALEATDLPRLVLASHQAYSMMSRRIGENSFFTQHDFSLALATGSPLSGNFTIAFEETTL